MKSIGPWTRANAFRIVSVLLAGYFFWIFHLLSDFPPIGTLTPTSTTFLILSIFFLLLPFAKKLKLGKLLEYEARIDEIKKESKDFREQITQTLLLQNSLINTVSNTLHQNINITIPGLVEAKEAKEELDETLEEPGETYSIEDDINEFLDSEGSDLNFALAKLRMEIERELRIILGKKTETPDPLGMNKKFLSARSLFREFLKLHPKYQGMYKSLDYILKICNAAIHGQKISQGHAHEALYMGLRMLDELKKVI